MPNPVAADPARNRRRENDGSEIGISPQPLFGKTPHTCGTSGAIGVVCDAVPSYESTAHTGFIGLDRDHPATNSVNAALNYSAIKAVQFERARETPERAARYV